MSDDFLAKTEALLSASELPEEERASLRLRIFADHFCARSDHASIPLARILTALCEAIPHAASAAVAHSAYRLAVHPQTDGKLLAGLVAFGGDVAAVVFRFGRFTEPQLLAKVAESGEASSASAIAERDDLTPALATILARRPEPDILIALAGNRSFQLDRASAAWLVSRARHDAKLASVLLTRGPFACDMTPLFMSADRSARATMIVEGRRRDVGLMPEFRVPWPNELVAEFERSLAQRDHGLLAGIFAQRLGLSRGDAMRFMLDSGGEPLALMCSGAHAEPFRTTAILCWLQDRAIDDPTVARLLALSTGLAPHSARRILSAIIGRPLVNRQQGPTRGEPAADNSAALARHQNNVGQRRNFASNIKR